MYGLRRDIHVPVVCIPKKDKSCDVYCPDLGLTAHGYDYVAAIANATYLISAVYYYNVNCNNKVEFKTTYADVEALAIKKKHGAFATLLNLTDG